MMRKPFRLVMIVLLGVVTGLLSNGQSTQGGPSAQFSIVAGQGPANGEINFNGTSKGKLVITVPLGAQVKLTLTNQGTLPHSLEIIPATRQLPAQAVEPPVFPGAEVPSPVAGIPKGKTAVAQFTAAKAGKYPLICGFPGHAILGMYATFVVSPSPSARASMTVAK
jgi:sulfocyanin